MQNQENSMDSIVILPEPDDLSNQSSPIYCFDQHDFQSFFPNKSHEDLIQENSDLKLILKKLHKENFELKHHFQQQLEILYSDNLRLKSKLEEQTNILLELCSYQIPAENYGLNLQEKNSDFLNFNFKQNFIEFLQMEIFEQKIFFKEKMFPIINDPLFIHSEKIIFDQISEFYKNKDLICKIKFDKQYSNLDLISKFDKITDKLFSYDNSIENKEKKNLILTPENTVILNSITRSLLKLNLIKLSTQNESIVHNIYSSMDRLFRFRIIFDDESMQELGDDIIDKLILPVLNSAGIIHDVFFNNIYGLLNKELTLMGTLVLTSVANDIQKNLKDFLNVYIKVYKIINQKAIEKKMNRLQIGPRGENILNYLAYLELLKDLALMICGSFTRQFVTYEPDHLLIKKFLLDQKNGLEKTWLNKLKKSFFNVSTSEFSLLKTAHVDFAELIFNCSYSLFLTNVNFTKKSTLSIGKIAIYHFAACFSPNEVCCDSSSTLEFSHHSLSSEVD